MHHYGEQIDRWENKGARCLGQYGLGYPTHRNTYPNLIQNLWVVVPRDLVGHQKKTPNVKTLWCVGMVGQSPAGVSAADKATEHQSALEKVEAGDRCRYRASECLGKDRAGQLQMQARAWVGQTEKVCL